MYIFYTIFILLSLLPFTVGFHSLFQTFNHFLINLYSLSFKMNEM